MNSEQEFFWFIGILEGEGCFSKTPSSPLVNVHMTDQDTMKRVAMLMGTDLESQQPPGNRKIAYTARIYGDLALSLMRKVKPYMSERRQARINEVQVWAAERPGVFTKLNDEAVKAIRWAHRKGKLQREIADVYDISQSLVSLITRNEAWTHV